MTRILDSSSPCHHSIRSLYKCIPCARERADVPVKLMPLAPLSTRRRLRRSDRCPHDSRRGHKSQKAYIALFVCLTTKALHLELVSDYTSPTFITAYQRFVARRGLPTSMYSDNGTTFHGADRELSNAQRPFDSNFRNRLTIDGTAWHFVPSASPHCGGLWKAGVKSVKHHLK